MYEEINYLNEKLDNIKTNINKYNKRLKISNKLLKIITIFIILLLFQKFTKVYMLSKECLFISCVMEYATILSATYFEDLIKYYKFKEKELNNEINKKILELEKNKNNKIITYNKNMINNLSYKKEYKKVKKLR